LARRSGFADNFRISGKSAASARSNVIPFKRSVLFIVLLVTLPAVSAAGPLREYGSELGEVVTQLKTGTLKQAAALLEKNNTDQDKDILYYLEKGEIFSLGGNYADGRDSWLKADEIIQLWENEFRSNPAKLFGDIGSYLISDKTRRYDGQDYEKVLLSTRLTQNHIMLGRFDDARVEMKKTYEREKLIEAFREKEYDALKAEAEKQQTGEIAKLDGYPMAELDTAEVRELKNGFQNAFAHYLAGYFFDVTHEPSLAEPGYRNALQLAPGKRVIEQSLEGVGSYHAEGDKADVLFVIETGFAPKIESLNIPIPIPRRNGTIITPLSFPLIKSSPPVPVPASLSIAGQALPVDTLTNTDAMARRLLKDQMPGTILRTVIRAGIKSVVQDQADKAHWIAGLIAKVVTVATEQADDRSWRTLPERISVARAQLPHGRHALEFQTSSGNLRSEVEVAGRFTIVPIRITGDAVYVGQRNLTVSDVDFVAARPVQPSQPGQETAAGLADPEPGAAAEPAPALALGATPASTLLPAEPSTPTPIAASAPAESVDAPRALPPAAARGKRVKVGDSTFIGDFSFGERSGLASGQGVIEWDNGRRFEGRLENGLKQGQGVFDSPGNFRYEGEWARDLQNGRGKTIFASGDIYEGAMKDGVFDGVGTYTASDGLRYEGNWSNGVKEGQGRLVYPDGDSWEGVFKNDERTGEGAMHFVNKPFGRPATADKKAISEAISGKP
jgi:hypothetical protein